MTVRNRKLLDLAHDMPCFADYPHKCYAYLGCDPAHSDSQMFGRGHGHKSHDFAFASLCNEAHRMLDTFERDEQFFAFLRAFVKTQEYLWENNLIQVTPKK